jgi:quercetin dioxygenase-like cupin family protein
MSNMSKVLRCEGFRWDAVPVRRYKTGGSHFKAITRQTLLGEREDESGLNFLTRYFEIERGGYSSLERHRHPHTVMVIRGRGRVVLGDATQSISTFDCVYVAPGTIHQFQAAADEPLGFVCIVDRDRDRPVLVLPNEATEGAEGNGSGMSGNP